MTETVDFHCVEGWTVDDVRWGGVAPAVLLDQAGVRPEAKYAVFYAYGGAYLSTPAARPGQGREVTCSPTP